VKRVPDGFVFRESIFDRQTVIAVVTALHQQGMQVTCVKDGRNRWDLYVKAEQ
jgi:hypothetical protein